MPLLLCPQSLFKIHPDNDALFARVLAAVPDAAPRALRGPPSRADARSSRRGSRAAGIGAARVRMLPQCAHDDFLRVNRVCDAMLDTLHWSGGNTSLDALACGLPIVTLPGRFMRGRQSAAMLAMMGVDELVARDVDDYVRIVARSRAMRACRAALAQRIRDAHARVFDDPAPVAAFARGCATTPVPDRLTLSSRPARARAAAFSSTDIPPGKRAASSGRRSTRAPPDARD